MQDPLTQAMDLQQTTLLPKSDQIFLQWFWRAFASQPSIYDPAVRWINANNLGMSESEQSNL